MASNLPLPLPLALALALAYQVANLARFISVLKFRPLIWRNSHPSVPPLPLVLTRTLTYSYFEH